MAEEKKGKAKLTVEFEVNEALMEVMKESISKMPESMMRMGRREREGEK